MWRARSIAVVGVFVLIVAGCDWTTFGYGPARTSSTPDTSISESAVAAGNLTLKWTATADGGTSSPAVANGVVYVDTIANHLEAFDAAGNTGCASTPRSCAPLWTATIGAGTNPSYSSPAVANGVVYVGSPDGGLYAFDAAGSAGCSGTPRTCAPLWKGTTDPIAASSPVVANGVAYVSSSDGRLYAFDAAGSAGCSGTPKACAPLWTAATSPFADTAPAVVNGVVYIAAGLGLYAFDAAGNTSCSGTPKTCDPLWTARAANSVQSGPAIANGVAYVVTEGYALQAFDAGGGDASCSGISPARTCTPLWTGPFPQPRFPATIGLSIASGTVYVGGAGGMFAFDAGGGAASCTGATPNRTCTPLWSAPTDGDVFGQEVVANGVVYVGAEGGTLYAFDAAGTTSCSGTPKTCAPLWSTVTDGEVVDTPTIANGSIYVSVFTSSSGVGLRVYGLE